MEAINFEAFVISWFNQSGIKAFADVPDGKLVKKPSEFVTVEMTSSSTNGIAVGTVDLAVQSWAESRYAASDLAQKVDRLMFGLVNNENPITNVYRNSLYNYPSTQDEPRYQGIYELTVHLFK